MSKPDTYVITVQFTRSISADAEVCGINPDDPNVYDRLVTQFIKELQMAYEPESDIGMDGQFELLSLVHGDKLVRIPVVPSSKPEPTPAAVDPDRDEDEDYDDQGNLRPGVDHNTAPSKDDPSGSWGMQEDRDVQEFLPKDREDALRMIAEKLYERVRQLDQELADEDACAFGHDERLRDEKENLQNIIDLIERS